MMETEEPKLEPKAEEVKDTVDEYYPPDNAYPSKPGGKKRISGWPLGNKARNQSILGSIVQKGDKTDKKAK